MQIDMADKIEWVLEWMLQLWLCLKKPVLMLMIADSIFHQEHNATWMNYQISQSSGLLLLTAFPKHSGDPYKLSGALLEFWPAWGWLYVALQHHDVG